MEATDVTEISEQTKRAIEAVRGLVPKGKFSEACDELRRARDVAQRDGSVEEEVLLTSMLISHLSIAGDDEQALGECRSAMQRHPNRQGVEIKLIRQLLKMKELAEAEQRCERLIAEKPTDERHHHEGVALLGEILLGRDRSMASSKLNDALVIARQSDLEPVYWNRSLARKLARLGEHSGLEYLQALRDAARRSEDVATISEVDGLLCDMR